MVLLLPGLITFGQQGTILVVDQKTNETIPFAHICFENVKSGAQKNFITDSKGVVNNAASEESKLTISYVGYETFIAFISPGQSLTVKLKPAVFNMNEVVITAQFAPEKADKSIYKINVINSRTIEQKASTNLSDLLTSESNMRLSQGGILGSNLSIQGLSGENVKILIDGVPVVGRLNGNIDLTQLNLFNVDHIEIIEGPMSVIYGSNAIAGVINIITKENKFSSTQAFANAYYETVGVYNINAGVSKRKNRNQAYFDFSRNFFDGYNQSGNSRQMDWKPRRQYNADGYFLHTGNKLRLKLSAQIFNEMLLDKGPLLGPYYETAVDNHFLTLRSTWKVESNYTISKNRNLNLIAAFSHYNRARNVYSNDLTIPEKTLTAKGDTTRFGSMLGRALYNRNLENQKVNYQVGFDGNYEWTKGDRIASNSRSIGDFATFLTLKYNPYSSLTIQPGVRLMYNTRFKAPLVYSLNTKYALTKNTAFRMSYARGYRAPSLKEMFLSFVDINHNIKGNELLKAEYSHNVNFQFSYNRETSKAYLNTEAALFYNYVDNTIWLFNTGENSTSYTYGNVASFISKGTQLNATVSFYPAITLKGGWALVGRRFPSSEIQSAETVYNYSNDFNFMMNYKLRKPEIVFTANYKYTGNYPLIDPEGTFDGKFIEGYHSLDITLMKTFFDNRVTVSCGGKNLFDVKDVAGSGAVGGAHSGSSDGASRVAWGRTGFIKLSYNFNKI